VPKQAAGLSYFKISARVQRSGVQTEIPAENLFYIKEAKAMFIYDHLSNLTTILLQPGYPQSIFRV